MMQVFFRSKVSEERDRRIREKDERSREALLKENARLREQLTQSRITLNHLQSTYEQMKSQRNKAREEIADLHKKLQSLISSLVAVELARTRLHDRETVDSWSLDQLVDFVIDTARGRERELRSRVNALQAEVDDLSELVEQLKSQVHNLQQARLRMADLMQEDPEKAAKDASTQPAQRNDNAADGESDLHDDENDVIFTEEEIDQLDDFVWPGDEEPQVNNSRPAWKDHRPLEDRREQNMVPSRERREERKEQPKPLYVENLSDLASNLTPEHHVLLEIIGKEGIFRTPELREHPRFLETFSPTSNYFMQQIQDLATLGILEQKTVRVGARGHNYDTFRLTPKGVQLYEALYGQEPVRSQLDVLLEQHSSEEHALLVLDTKIVFERAGYEVDDSREGNTVRLPDGTFAVFDLTVRKGTDVRRIECERGKQPEADIHNKLDKWLQITPPRFFYVCPNKAAKESVKEKFYRWAAKHGRATLADKHVVAYFITLEDLKKGVERGNTWEEIRF